MNGDDGVERVISRRALAGVDIGVWVLTGGRAEHYVRNDGPDENQVM